MAFICAETFPDNQQEKARSDGISSHPEAGRAALAMGVEPQRGLWLVLCGFYGSRCRHLGFGVGVSHNDAFLRRAILVSAKTQ